MRLQSGCNKVAIELRVVQFCSEIFHIYLGFQITRMISDPLHSVNYHYSSALTRLKTEIPRTNYLFCKQSQTAKYSEAIRKVRHGCRTKLAET